MNVPTSIILVLLAVAWLVVLVPMVARRREKVHRSPAAGAGLRVLRRASGSLRRPHRRSGVSHHPIEIREEQPVSVGTGPQEHAPVDAAEEWAAEQAQRRPRVVTSGREEQRPETDRLAEVDEDEIPRYHGSTRYEPEAVAAADDQVDEQAPGTAEPLAEFDTDEIPTVERPSHLQAVAEPAAPAAPLQDEWDEADWESSRGGATGPSDYDRVTEHNDEELRPVPRRAGRGGFDPDAAEATRAYRYQQRRRVTLALLIATVVFALGGALASSVLWWPAAVSALLLVAYLSYLRRQVTIEAQIRRRRMEKLQQARQVRPAVELARARSEREATLYRNRRVVDVEDDDPVFEHLEYHEVQQYRRAVGE